ncbi:hypothetical protein ACRALDRAFT_1065374 [Sodiomyces alcalophilus JCM 7366]|uniref:uncharacterized protein n=1 Tax=Sodiomyces alcalophilus JCM 7366 TaxID=591952 RepID=UPI0039B639C2
MAKKRKASGRNEKPSGPKDVDPADARLGPITTYEDVANSEDEYFLNRDKIIFNEEPQSKRRRRQDEEDKFLEISEEEILDDDDDDDDSDEEEEADIPARKRAAAGSDDDDEKQQGEDVEDSGWWGDSKTEYYDADQIETEADALEEEAEAKRLQQKKLSKMAEEDFLFDQSAWLDAKPDEEDDGDVVTEVLKDVEVTDDMTPDDRTKLLRTRYPEFEYLVAEFQELQPKLAVLQKEATGKSGKSIEAVRYWVLGCYVAALASYFAILTSPSRDGSTTSKILHPSELRDHEVMETLVSCRNAWRRLGQVQTVSKDPSAMDIELPEEEDGLDTTPHTKEERLKLQQERKQRKAKDKAKKAKDKRAREIEDSLADLDSLLRTQKRSKTSKAATVDVNGTAATDGDDDHSDFGEEEFLDAQTAKDKAARKKSLRFYTSQIVQKANRRADAGRDAGGDMDIPYRERLRDRQARLNAEAERRGKKFGADLGDDGDSNDDDDEEGGARGGDDDDEYYDMVAGASKKKKEEKAARQAALAAASRADRVVEREVVGEDGKRKITYAIEKNKGLAPRRKKEQRNPRVKKKMQYDAKQKKLRSMKATFKGGEPRGGYGGELSGISTHVVRSRKL